MDKRKLTQRFWASFRFFIIFLSLPYARRISTGACAFLGVQLQRPDSRVISQPDFAAKNAASPVCLMPVKSPWALALFGV
ncbi:hypothetical protein BBH88_00725 [Planococcus antarcticus DSM 14505]|uniref:Uncharacterized protein n=1 Tax=Planococcus antarcticus DSM 14505 TaxID=1185653 RepID=A0ABM6D0T0_9BACL|nr:hypothetical protein BBH88_00725 [Planococcus antarcticus DSM 14505]